MEPLTGRGKGFASLSPERRREIASSGGNAAWHIHGTAHKWTGGPDGTAAKAGRLGGTISRKRGPDKLHKRRDVA